MTDEHHRNLVWRIRELTERNERLERVVSFVRCVVASVGTMPEQCEHEALLLLQALDHPAPIEPEPERKGDEVEKLRAANADMQMQCRLLSEVEDVLIAADEDYGPDDATPSYVLRRILAERDQLRERIRVLEDALRAALEAVPDPNVIPCECSCSEGECYCARIRKQCLSALTAPASDGAGCRCVSLDDPAEDCPIHSASDEAGE